jgi:hypothetical protein
MITDSVKASKQDGLINHQPSTSTIDHQPSTINHQTTWFLQLLLIMAGAVSLLQRCISPWSPRPTSDGKALIGSTSKLRLGWQHGLLT